MNEKDKISKRNDLFRQTMLSDHSKRIVLTESVSLLPPKKLEQLLEKIRGFDSFNKENDPHGEHDFRKILIEGITYFWKIDYYDQNFEYGADPTEETVNLVLTIMNSDEY